MPATATQIAIPTPASTSSLIASVTPAITLPSEALMQAWRCSDCAATGLEPHARWCRDRYGDLD